MSACKPPFILDHPTKYVGKYLILPIDIYQTPNGLTTYVQDRYEFMKVGRWRFVHREVGNYESHRTAKEYYSCSICNQVPQREYGKLSIVRILTYDEINDEGDGYEE